MVISGAWWDFVDPLAKNHLGKLLMQFGDTVQPELEKWINDPNLWIRRAAILAPLKFRDSTREHENLHSPLS